MKSPLTIRAFVLVSLASETDALAPSTIAQLWRERYSEELYDGRFYRALAGLRRENLIMRLVRKPNDAARQIVYGLTEPGKEEAAKLLFDIHALAVGD